MTQTTQDPARTALARLASRGYTNPSDVTTALSQLSEHFPVVAPGGTTNCAVIPEGFQALVTYVVAQPPTKNEKGFDEGGDVFWHPQTKTWCFKHAFLKKLAAGIGLEWLGEKRLDTFQHPFLCVIEVRGRYRDYSGEWRTITGSHQLDLRDEAEHGMKPGQLKAARGKIHQLCASFAKSRAIADACVSRTIADADLGRPIVMAKLFRTQAIDSDAAAAALYGQAERETIDESTGEIQDVEHEVRDAAPTAGGFVVPDKLPGGGKRLPDLTSEELEACRSRTQDLLDAGTLGEDQEEKARRFMDALVAEWESRQQGDGVEW